MLETMRKYVYAFVNSHDFEVPREIMSSDYTLHMGTNTLVGRDDHYLPAVRHQFAQFPNLGYTIHDLIAEEDHTAVLFSEHGASLREPHHLAAWTGVAIYRAEHGRLAECWVEQDHLGRRHQIATGTPDPLGPPAIDPWTAHASAAHGDEGDALDQWRSRLTHWPPIGADFDPGQASAVQPQIDVESTSLNAVVIGSGRLAFNITVRGRYTGGFADFDHKVGTPVETYAGAFASVHSGILADIHGVSNRVAVQRQLKDG
ncbi:nuclear transport factor 2 family protein [Williamsia muralis]|uniref:ester cyclase n=1 Tax=Williamsia marianensis TaxID=85044 RepID=UPI003F16F3CE